MDYTELAQQFFRNAHAFLSTGLQKMISETLQGELFALIYIARSDGGVLPGEISSQMQVSTARVASALNSLERKGLITRQIDVSDRRQILVNLTEAGKELADKHKHMALDHCVHMLEHLGERDSRELIRILGKMAEIPPKSIGTQ